MARKLKTNRNLSLHYASSYTACTTLRQFGENTQVIRELPVFSCRDGLMAEHLNTCLRVINDALEDHPRTLAVRVDLRVPSGLYELPLNAISDFMEYFKARIKRDRRRAAREGYAKPCKVRYIWVRERDSARHDHFHVFLLLNQDAYPSLGRFKSDRTNLANRIKSSWAAALGLDVEGLKGCVHFPTNSEYILDASAEPNEQLLRLTESDDWLEMAQAERYEQLAWFNDCYEGLFYRVSYFCKTTTKVFGRGVRSFGCSQLRR